MDVATLRAGIPALKETVFFNSGGITPIPSVVADEVVDLIRLQEAQGRWRPDIQGMLAERSEEARATAASFFGVTPDEITFTHSVSEGLNIISEGIEWEPGDDIIISDHEHPSGFLPWALRAQQQGLAVKELSLTPEPEGMVHRLRGMLTDRTRAICLSHVTSALGIRVPADEIVQAGHEVGALVGFDGAQSAGQFPTDLREMGCDFYSVTSYKWCMGPYGIGALYVSRDALPRIAVRRSGAKAGVDVDLNAGTVTGPDAARKFEFGARNLPLRIGYARTLNYIDAIGLDAIEARMRDTVAYFLGRLEEIPEARVQTPDGFSAGAQNVAFEGVNPSSLLQRLWEKHKIVATSPAGGIRFSVAFFNTRGEVDCVVDALREELPKQA
ncbi:MAG: aminotransferase class V-fold PLP-dependent enzyme [Candidatus Latescibacteria bacterium]|jgi:selenocysteine lyase/cysteine desulfurase|nr:aminotransferase class V-fold PLP-dependent enzyme [Candidatus Latescibacterota bacterium]